MFNDQEIVSLCVEMLSEMHSTSVRLTGFHSVGGGCINHGLKISSSVGDFFLKWNPSTHPDLFLKEAEGLNEMREAENPFLTIPQVIWATRVRWANSLPWATR